MVLPNWLLTFSPDFVMDGFSVFPNIKSTIKGESICLQWGFSKEYRIWRHFQKYCSKNCFWVMIISLQWYVASEGSDFEKGNNYLALWSIRHRALDRDASSPSHHSCITWQQWRQQLFSPTCLSGSFLSYLTISSFSFPPYFCLLLPFLPFFLTFFGRGEAQG